MLGKSLIDLILSIFLAASNGWFFRFPQVSVLHLQILGVVNSIRARRETIEVIGILVGIAILRAGFQLLEVHHVIQLLGSTRMMQML